MYSIGIDLGTTNSTVAVSRAGHVDVILNSFGGRKTPSCVAFTDTERLVGTPAAHQKTKHYNQFMFDMKRIIGRSYQDPKVQENQKRWPFTVEDVNGKARIKLERKNKPNLSPEEITAMVVKNLSETAEMFLGGKVQSAVIAVPACFDYSQRQATMDAGKIAGLHVLQLINEPTAAALALAHKTKPERRTVLVYSLGAGAFDVSVINIQEGLKLSVLATAGDPHLGGCDFDELLVNHLAEEFKQKHGKEIWFNRKALFRLRLAVERLKQELTGLPESAVDIDSLLDGVDFNMTVTRACFENLCSALFNSTLALVKTALAAAGKHKDEIQEVLLVGGSTRIPMVKRYVQEFFPGTPLRDTVSSEDAVVHGAALLAAHLCHDEMQDLYIAEVTAHPLSIDVNGDVSPLVLANSRIPLVKDWLLKNPNVSGGMSFRVLKGEESGSNLLAEYKLNVSSALVKCHIDQSGLVELVLLDDVTGANLPNIVCLEPKRLTGKELEEMRSSAKKYREEEKQERRRCEVRNQLEQYVYWMKSKTTDDHSISLTVGQKAEIILHCDSTLGWLEENPMATEQVYRERLQLSQKGYNDITKKRNEVVYGSMATRVRLPSTPSGTGYPLHWSKRLILLSIGFVAYIIALLLMLFVFNVV